MLLPVCVNKHALVRNYRWLKVLRVLKVLRFLEYAYKR